ncbi:hypothetical protein INS49_004669 [Diaporthe citri]|uniref:uncharacterized protein n=1 Tax=Diaporthe citri TaxID=83186 RepID=UPI001C80D589|nr:uncharacterized protein INS49_004669 [Diaporthe citri]KAG6354651.1 hypothetical protein INS49_004669 [Diaporthe citri]
MQFFISLLVLVSIVAADGTVQKPEIPSAPAIELEPRDLIDEISSFTSAIAAAPSYLESSVIREFSSRFANLTASAASATSSLGLQLSTADAAASTSIQSQLSQVAANVSSASAALQAAQSAVNSTSASSSATSSSTGGVGCAPTAA